METIMISTILVNICIGCFACVGLTTAISMIQSIINDHKREKREQEKDKRDLEYHEKRMKHLVSILKPTAMFHFRKLEYIAM